MKIEDQLDQLAEFQSQADLLELNRQELLNQVKIPAEVLAAQDEANKRRQEIESKFWKRQKEIQTAAQEMLSEIRDPEMPPEFVKALEDARKRRAEIQADADAQIERDRKKMSEATLAIDNALREQVSEVYRQVEQRKFDINAEFEEKSQAVEENIEKLKEQIKTETEKLGESVKGKFYQAVYSKGRTTWTTDTLDTVFFSLASLYSRLKDFGHPEFSHWVADIIENMTKARKVGKPSISIRKN